MRDKDRRRTELLLQIAHHLKYLRLNGHIQRSRRLVRQKQARFERQRDGDHHALLHAAGELMRIFILARRRNADHLQDLFDAFFDLQLLHIRLVLTDGFSDLLAHLEDRIQAGHRVLKDHGDLRAADRTHIRFRAFEQVAPLKIDLAGCDLTDALGQQPHDGERRGRLARAGLAYQPQRFALIELERNAVERVNVVLLRVIDHGKVAYLRNDFVIQLFHLSSSCAGQARRADRRPAG